MAQILRGLNDALVARLKERSSRNDRSLQGEIKAILKENAPPLATKVGAIAIVDKWRCHWQEQGETFSDSAEIIRKMRDA